MVKKNSKKGLSASLKKTQNKKNTLLKKRLSSVKKKPLVQLRNVDVSFGHGVREVKAMKDISFNIYEGEVLGLVGESGSGKTTIGNTILGLINRKSGEIKIGDLSLPLKSKKIKGSINNKLINKVQMIFQDPAASLNPHKNIYNVVSEGLNNIDIKNIFARVFDGDTVHNISNILVGKTQPKNIKKLSVKKLIDLIDKQEYTVISKILYEDSVDSLIKMNKPHSLKAADYLLMRKELRNKYFAKGNISTKKIKRHIVVDTLKAVGLSEHILKRYPLEFSGGQQQRIGISRAVAMRPQLLVADEPISALDVSIQAQVVNIFSDLKEKFGLTILFIAHDLRMVEYISDRIAVIYRGEILEIGETKNIIKYPLHPYTKSLLDSVPSINVIGKSLRGTNYNQSIHKYTEQNGPKWIKVKGKEHYVYASQNEFVKWGGK